MTEMICRCFGHKWNYTHYNKWYIFNHRVCDRCKREQEHTWAQAFEYDDKKRWVDVKPHSTK